MSADEETLVGRAQLCNDNRELKLIIGDGPEITCDSDDVATVIGADPRLNEIRANQVTRIAASAEALNDLHVCPVVPGDIDDYHEALWSEHLAAKYLDQAWETQTGCFGFSGGRGCEVSALRSH